MRTYIAYYRKSTDTEDKQMLSLEGQARVVKEFAESKNLHIPKNMEFEESYSAKNAGKRPVFNQIVELLLDKKADGVIAYKADRLTRNFGDLDALINLLSHDVEVWATDYGQYVNNPTGLMILGMNAVLAKHQIDNLSDIVKRGLTTKLTMKEWPGWAPMGYLNIDPNGKISGKSYSLIKQQKLEEKGQPLKVIEPDPITGPIIKKAFELYAYQDFSLSTLRDHLHDCGLRNRSGNKLSRTTVEQMLKNPFHYGIFRWKGELYQGCHEPLIDKDLFEMVQDRLSGKAPYKSRSYKLDFLYKGLIRCGECGCSITAENHYKKQKNGNKHHYVYYRCTKAKGICSQGYIEQSLLEEDLIKIFQSFWLSDQQQSEIKDRLRVLFREDIEYQEGQTKTLNARLTKLKNAKKTLFHNYALGDIADQEAYQSVKNDFTNEMAEIEQSLHNINQHTQDYLSQASNLLELSSNAAKLFLEGTKEEKQTLINCVASNLFLKDKKLEFSLKEPFNILADAQNCTTLLPR